MCEVMVENVCTYQGGQLHHRRPRARGGSRRDDTNLASNALCLCPRCHDWVESHRLVAMDNGWVIPNNRRPPINPASVPVLWRGEERWLDEQGGLLVRPPASEVA